MRDQTDSRTLPLPLPDPALYIAVLMLVGQPCGNYRAVCTAAEYGFRPLWGVINTKVQRRA